MTYPEAQTLLDNARTLLQDAKHRIDVLKPEIDETLTLGGDLTGQIPPAPFGGYTEDPPTEFQDAVTAQTSLAATLSARILPE